MDARSVAARLLPRTRLRRLWRKAGHELYALLPVSRTIHRLSSAFEPPAPGAFAAFGDGSWVVPPARVPDPARVAIGTRTVIMEHSVLAAFDDSRSSGRITIGDGVTLARFTSIISAVGVTIEDNVASSDSVTIFDTWEHPHDRVRNGDGPSAPEGGPVVIESGAYLGFNSIIGPGVRVGQGAFVGEGSVVLDDVPAHAVVYGSPATVTRRFEPSTGTWEGPLWP